VPVVKHFNFHYEEAMSKRRFWQIHLSTAVVLMLCGALMLGLNFYPRSGWYDRNSGGLPEYLTKTYYGFPINAFAIGSKSPAQLEADPDATKYISTSREWAATDGAFYSFSAAILNTFCCVLIVGAVAIVLETNIRRREARKP
jgi:hypothetical protein